jgi:hypothetical protein
LWLVTIAAAVAVAGPAGAEGRFRRTIEKVDCALICAATRIYKPADLEAMAVSRGVERATIERAKRCLKDC